MRWDNLTIDEEQRTALAGYREPAVVRHFDAPEALDMSFYEVRAKSALNRVPEKSRMPFRWTINPYRGCSHACVYCLDGETPILMGDGRPRAIAELREGDEIYGTMREGRYRRYVRTRVLARWSTVKPAYRVTLGDGTELVASGDHRFLTERGWKSVTGARQGLLHRPHLTTGNSLLGTGRFATAPEPDAEYRRGYLCGMVRGDGHIGAYSVATTEFAFAAGSERRRPTHAVRTSTRSAVDRVGDVIRWPLSPSVSWRKGFLAGIFDTEGSAGGVIRIASTDPAIISWAVACLEHLGFDTVVEGPSGERAVRSVRVRGGLRERLRFFHTVDPAIVRKRDIEGVALESDADLRVVAIEPIGRALELYDITTGTGDFIANGVVSHNCFARPTHKYLDMDAGSDFERRIVVKVNLPEVLRAELRRPSWKGEHVAMGTNTDPYQWVEGRYKLMPEIWAALRDARNPCSVLTKSPLVLRDLPLLQEIAAVTDVHANLSVPTIDEKAWRATEPHTPSPRARLEAVAQLNRAGIPAGVLVAPLMPGINDDPRQVEEILRLAADAGATTVGGITLHLRGEVRGIFMEWLRSYRPDLVPRYEELYASGAYAPTAERERVEGLLRRGRRAAGLPARSDTPRLRGFSRRAGAGGAPAAGAGASVPGNRGSEREGEHGRAAPPAPAAVQEALF